MWHHRPKLNNPPKSSIGLTLPHLAATGHLANAIAPVLQTRDVLALRGNIGVGKTTFVRALIRSLGGTEEVPSPTFNLLYVYELNSLTIWHFDLFRVERLNDVYELGAEDALETGVSLVEWPDIMQPLIPADRLEIEFSYQPGEARHVAIRGYGTWPQRLAHLESLVYG
jgi:tRNA threonylcarbamoyladenosine biosynthesis protein TsaE